MKEGDIFMDKSVYKGVGSAVRNLVEVPRGRGPKSVQTALKAAGMAADAAAILFAVATGLRVLSEIIKGKK